MPDDRLVRLLKQFQIQVPGGLAGAIERKELLKAEFMRHANEMITRKLYQVLNQENGNAEPETNLR